MPRYDFTAPRLYLPGPIGAGVDLPLDKAQANYLRNVLRLRAGETVLAFDGRNGEWQTELVLPPKGAALRPLAQCRPQPPAPDLVYCFAPLKHARLDYLVQKAVEMGAGVLQPVITRRTQAARVNRERMQANVVEAAEQCGVLHLPDVNEPVRLDALLAAWPTDRLLAFCDEAADVADPIAMLRARPGSPSRLGVLIGPEGGFDEAERAALGALPQSVRIALGPRILRADTAGVAALAVLQAALGDWR